MDTCPRPFKGVVLCTTGIQDKVRIAVAIVCVCDGRLTGVVADAVQTSFRARCDPAARVYLSCHASDRDGPRGRKVPGKSAVVEFEKPLLTSEQCAVERRTPIMKPSWITECYQVWLRGDDVDFEEASVRSLLLASVNTCNNRVSSPTNSQSSLASYYRSPE